jgi:hypothetical protein
VIVQILRVRVVYQVVIVQILRVRVVYQVVIVQILRVRVVYQVVIVQKWKYFTSNTGVPANAFTQRPRSQSALLGRTGVMLPLPTVYQPMLSLNDQGARVLYLAGQE